MDRIAVIGNAGGGKSTLARALATRRRLPHVEADALLWRDGWQPAPEEEHEAEHARLIAEPRWVDAADRGPVPHYLRDGPRLDAGSTAPGGGGKQRQRVDRITDVEALDRVAAR